MPTSYHIDDPSPGSFGSAANDALVAAKAEYAQLIQRVKSESSELAVQLSTGVGSLPVYDFGEIKGVHVQADLNRYADTLGILADLIIFLAYLVAFTIIMGVRK